MLSPSSVSSSPLTLSSYSSMMLSNYNSQVTQNNYAFYFVSIAVQIYSQLLSKLDAIEATCILISNTVTVQNRNLAVPRLQESLRSNQHLRVLAFIQLLYPCQKYVAGS